MVSRNGNPTDENIVPKQTDASPTKARAPRGGQSPTKREEKPKAQDVSELKDYQLGDCLGKGAFGSVYRALNWGTGETVAVKQIKLADLPKSELRVIMLEIDLLKNLDHPNIVKYHGFVKTPETLNIILEYCENGSLHSISKNFGRFPENLVALYMSQVLHGLLYLHEQGVIHRDIKGANILTTKQGLVKLADFGVASRTTGLHEGSVVGTPYWMAPEVIELSGATTASDIWSLGCTVIELLEGKPPYHKLQPMPALFRIVKDDHPPLPSGASPAVIDFLMQCFQKDPNLRVSARKLLKHPWISNAKRAGSIVHQQSTEYEEAVKSVQEWNEALKSPDAGSTRKTARLSASSPIPPSRDSYPPLRTPTKSSFPPPLTLDTADKYRSPEGETDDNWDNDFASAISPSALHLPQLRPLDHFGGMLSSEKLKTFAALSGVAEHPDYYQDTENEMTLRSPITIEEHEDFQTVRPLSAKKNEESKNTKKKSEPKARRKSSLPSARQATNLAKSRPPQGKPASQLPPHRLYRENSVEDYSDIIAANENELDRKLAGITLDDEPSMILESPSVTDLMRSMRPENTIGSYRRQSGPKRTLSMRRTRSSVEIQKFAENEADEDFSDVFADGIKVLEKPQSDEGSPPGTLMLNSKVSVNSWLGDGNEDDEDDPFAQLEENMAEIDLETNIARDRQARLRSDVENLVGQLKVSQDDEVLLQISEDLMNIFAVFQDTKAVIISAHGLLPILEILETCIRLDIILNLLKIINAIIFNDTEVQENLCFVGGIPKINKFASKRFPREIRLEAAAFVRQMYQTSTLTLQMFVSAGGLTILVDFLEDDYDDDRELVLIGVNGIWSVFELQGSTPKNDFCRILSRNSVLDPLSLVLSRVLTEPSENGEQRELAELCEARIANIFFIFSQAENYVKELVADRTVLHRVLRDLKKMSPQNQITMLKFIKNLSMLTTTLDVLHNSNAIDVLTELLGSSMQKPHFRELSNQILNTLYNLCRLSKRRQEDAALDGIIPLLIKIVQQERPLKEFALPILCDMAHSSKAARRELWRHKGLAFYISLLSDPYWQVTALDAIFTWLQEETSRVQDALLENQRFTTAICASFTTSKSHSFENLLDPLQKLLRLSPAIAASMARPDLFERIGQKLNHNKPAIRLNLLRIVRSICDASEEQGALLIKFGLLEVIRDLEINDPAVLVRNMAQELVKSCEDSEDLISNASSLSGGPSGGKKRSALRRTSTTTTPPHLLERQMSIPGSPRISTGWEAREIFDRDGTVYYDRPDRVIQTPRRTRTSMMGTSSYGLRPGSRDASSNRPVAGFQIPSAPASPAFGRPSTRNNVSSTGTPNSDVTSVRSRLPRTSSTASKPPRQQPLRSESNLSNLAGQTGAMPRVSVVGSRLNRDRLYEGRKDSVSSVTPEINQPRRATRRQTSGSENRGQWSS